MGLRNRVSIYEKVRRRGNLRTLVLRGRQEGGIGPQATTRKACLAAASTPGSAH